VYNRNKTTADKPAAGASITDRKGIVSTMDEKEYEGEYYTLTDEDGNELQFEVIGSAELGGTMYYAMIPVQDQPENADCCEYVILKAETDENGEEVLVTIDDDDEFDDVADYFDDMLSDEADYDLNLSEDQ
jgi:uncharacterized protein YrzB (UPF0473 family)